MRSWRHSRKRARWRGCCEQPFLVPIVKASSRMRPLWRLVSASLCGLAVACADSMPVMDLAAPPRTLFRGGFTTTAPAPRPSPAPPPAIASLYGVDRSASWVVMLRRGRVHTIREVQGARGQWRVNLYAFDTLGTLRAYSDRGFATSDTSVRDARTLEDLEVLDVSAVSSPDRTPEDLYRTAVVFEAGLPILYARRGREGPHGIQRVEFKNLVARAHALYAYAQTRQGTVTTP